MSPETTFLAIHQELYANDQYRDARAFINFYEDYFQQIIALDASTSSPSLFEKILQIHADYAHACFTLQLYAKALRASSKALELFHQHPTVDPSELSKIDFYEILLFQQANTNYQVGNKSTSRKQFQSLVKHFPKSTVYQQWLLTCQLEIYGKWDKVFLLISACSLLLAVGLDFSVDTRNWGIPYYFLLAIMALAVIGMGITTLLISKARKSYKRLSNST